MEVITIESQAYKNIMEKLEEYGRKSSSENDKPKETIVSNQEFLQLMKISKRTAQSWRDEGRISFSQIGGKIYYKREDIEDMLNRNYNKAFAKNGKL